MLASAAVHGGLRRTREDADVGELSEGCERRRAGDLEAPFDEAGVENGLFERDVDELVGRAARRGSNLSAVLLAQVCEAFGCCHGVCCLSLHTVEEQREPLLEVARLADSLKRVE